MKIRQRDNGLILHAFLLNLLLGSILVGVGFLLGHGTFYLVKDFNLQQIPFNMIARRCVETGDFGWLDNFELGTGLVGALGFYVLGSPFFWLTMLVPQLDYAVAVPCLFALKFAVAGTAATCYARQYVRAERFALLAGMLYAFSGWQLGNMNYNHFLDVSALFPFLLLALDQTVLDGKKGRFACMVALLMLTNYIFFVAIAVFLVLYFAVRLLSKEYRLTGRLFLRLAAESILGVGLAAVLLLPSIAFVLDNPRVSQTIAGSSLSGMLALKPYQYADLLRALLFPAEGIFGRSMILETDTTAAELYLPVLGMIPAFAFLFNHRKSWMSRLSVVCFVFMTVRVLNSSFTAFNAEYYSRWLFMPILILAVMSALQLESDDSLRPGLLSWAVTVGLFVVARLLWKYYFEVEFFPNKMLAFVMMGIAAAGVAVVCFFWKNRKKEWTVLLLFAAVFVQVTVCFSLNTYYLHKTWDRENIPAKELFYTVPKIEYPDGEEYYRTETKDLVMNAGIFSGAKPSVNLFASNISGSIFGFYEANEMVRSVNSVIPDYLYGYFSLLGVKYKMLPSGTLPSGLDSFGPEAVWSDSGTDFFPNRYYAGMGFAYKNALPATEYAEVPQVLRHLVCMDALVLDEDAWEKYGDLFEKKTAADYEDFPVAGFEAAVAEKSGTAAQDFRFTDGGYSFRAGLERDTLYYVAVPYDRGFTAVSNGKEVPVIRVQNGLIGIPLKKGENEVRLSYRTPWGREGLAVTAVSAAAFAVYLLAGRKKKSSRAEG